jgi:hypothetical protein
MVEPAPLLSTAQRWCDDEVLAAAYVKPNAPGRFELDGFEAIASRQLMKGRGVYFCERILLAVTSVEVVAIAADFWSIVFARRMVWKRSELAAVAVGSRDEHRPEAPGLLLTQRNARPALEVIGLGGDGPMRTVLDRLRLLRGANPGLGPAPA